VILAGLIVLVLCFAAFALWALHERRAARDQAARAESQSIAARALRAQSLDPKQSLALAAQAEDKRSTPQADEALRRALVGSPKPVVLVPKGRTVYGVDFSPDGRFVVTAGRGGSHVLSITGKPVATLDPQKRVFSARFSKDGGYVVTAGADGSVRIWRTSDWNALPVRLRIRAHKDARAAFTSDGRFLVAGGYPGWPNKVWRFANGRVGARLTKRDGFGGWIEPDGTARVVDATTAASAARLVEHDETQYSFATGPTGRLLVSAGGTDDLHTPVYRTRKRTVLMELPYAEGATLSPDGQRVAIQGSFGNEIWDLLGQEPQVILSGSSYGTAFSADGRFVASASADTEAASTRVWDSETGAVFAELPPQPPRFDFGVLLPDPYPQPKRPGQGAVGGGAVGSAEGGLPPAFALQATAGFSPDGVLVTTWGTEGGGAQLWQPFAVRQIARLRRGSSAAGLEVPLPTVVSPDGRLVAAADRNNVIGVWRTRDGKPLAPLRGSTRFVSGIALTPRGDLAAASSHDGSVRVWRVADGRLLHTLDAGEKRVGAVAIDPKGTLLASANEDGTVHVWRLPSGEQEAVLHLPTGSAAAVAFSGDGDRLVAGGRGGLALVWETGHWRDPVILRPKRSRTLVVQTVGNKDGERFVTLDKNGVARLWRSDGGAALRTLTDVDTVAFSPDGAQLLAGGGQATVRIVQAADGKDAGLLRGHTDVVNDARFSPDGGLIVTAGGSTGGADDPTVRIWQAATNGLIAVLTPSQSAVLRAMLAPDGRLVTVSDDGVRVFVCEPCLPPDRLRALAKQRLAQR
jgi:WD40 repeat protein